MTDSDDSAQILQSISASLDELLRLIRVMAYPTVKQMLGLALDTAGKRAVYNSLDGKRSTKDIQKMTGVNARYVSEWGQEWEKLGIVRSSADSSIKGRREKSFDLALFGISVSDAETMQGRNDGD